MTNIQTGIEDMAYRMIEHIVKKLYSRFDIHDESDSDEA